MEIIRLEEMKFGPKIFKRQKFLDSRGSFEMAIEFDSIKSAIVDVPSIAQVNILTNKKGALRGFHGAEEIENHWKIVTTIKGAVREAFLDLRKKSDTYGKVSFVNMDQNSHLTVVIPPGFAHAVQALEDDTIIMYATNLAYKDSKEKLFHPISSVLDDLWVKPVIISEKDKKASFFNFEPRNNL